MAAGRRTKTERRGFVRRASPGLRAALLLLACAMHAEAQDAGSLPSFKRVVIDDDPPRQPYYKMVGDLTGDGRSEIVVAGRAGPIVMYSRPGWKKTVIAEGGYNGGVNGELADLNGDGKLDIVMGGVVWFENPGTTDAAWRVVDNQSIHDIEVADLNGNGRLDLVCRDQFAFGRRGNAIFIYTQQESGTWQQTVLDCPHGEGIKVADVDGDSRPDIVIGGSGSGTPRNSGRSTPTRPAGPSSTRSRSGRHQRRQPTGHRRHAVGTQGGAIRGLVVRIANRRQCAALAGARRRAGR